MNLAMNIKRVGLADADDITKVRGIFRSPTEEEREAFIEFLEEYDLKGETGEFGNFVREQVASAVKSGRCSDERVLIEARFLWEIFKEKEVH